MTSLALLQHWTYCITSTQKDGSDNSGRAFKTLYKVRNIHIHTCSGVTSACRLCIDLTPERYNIMRSGLHVVLETTLTHK